VRKEKRANLLLELLRKIGHNTIMEHVKNSLQFIALFLCITILLSTSVIGISFLYYRQFLRKDTSVVESKVVQDDTSSTNPSVLGALYIPEQFIRNENQIWGVNSFLIGPNFKFKIEFKSPIQITQNALIKNCSYKSQGDDIECPGVSFSSQTTEITPSNEIQYFSLGFDGLKTEYTIRGWDVEYFQDIFGYVDRLKEPITFFKSIHKDESDEFFGCLESVCFILKQDGLDPQSVLQNISIDSSTEGEREEFRNTVIAAFSNEQ
jgi:hypothetical protein